jgi:hypothetical protein
MLQQLSRLKVGRQCRKNPARAADQKGFDPPSGGDLPQKQKTENEKKPNAGHADAAHRENRTRRRNRGSSARGYVILFMTYIL